MHIRNSVFFFIFSCSLRSVDRDGPVYLHKYSFDSRRVHGVILLLSNGYYLSAGLIRAISPSVVYLVTLGSPHRNVQIVRNILSKVAHICADI